MLEITWALTPSSPFSRMRPSLLIPMRSWSSRPSHLPQTNSWLSAASTPISPNTIPTIALQTRAGRWAHSGWNLMLCNSKANVCEAFYITQQQTTFYGFKPNREPGLMCFCDSDFFGKLCRVKRKSDVSYFSELHQTQPVAQPLLSESGPLSRRAWKRELLASGFCFWEQTGGTSFQETAAARGGLFQDAVRTPLLQVSGLPASSKVQV